MKIFFLVSALLISFSSFSSIEQTKGELNFDLTTANDSITLYTELFEPVIKQESYQTMCKDEIKRTISVCEPKWDDGSIGTIPHWYESCSTKIVYETREYECTKFREVVIGQKLVKKITHQIEAKVLNSELIKDKLAIDLETDHQNLKVSSSYIGQLLTADKKTTLSSTTIEDGVTVQNYSTKMEITLGIDSKILQKFKNVSIQADRLLKDGLVFELTSVEGLEKLLTTSIHISAKNVWRYSWHYHDSKNYTDFSKIAVKGEHSYKVKLPIAGIKKTMLFSITLHMALSFPENTINSNALTKEFGADFYKDLEVAKID